MHGTFPATKPTRALDRDGRLHVAHARLTRPAVLGYLADEFPQDLRRGLEANRFYQMLRGPDDLRCAALSFRGTPLLDGHGGSQVGIVGDDVAFDGKFLRGSVIVWDSDAIADIKSGRKVELSAGYISRPKMSPGLFDGRHHDGHLHNIVGTHVALVSAGRAGRACHL